MTEQKIRTIFKAHKADVPDKGFSERVVRKLSERKSLMPQTVIIVFTMTGVVITLAILGINPLFEQMESLITSIRLLQAPSLASIFSYLGILVSIGFIGFAVDQAGEG